MHADWIFSSMMKSFTTVEMDMLRCELQGNIFSINSYNQNICKTENLLHINYATKNKADSLIWNAEYYIKCEILYDI